MVKVEYLHEKLDKMINDENILFSYKGGYPKPYGEYNHNKQVGGGIHTPYITIYNTTSKKAQSKDIANLIIKAHEFGHHFNTNRKRIDTTRKRFNNCKNNKHEISKIPENDRKFIFETEVEAWKKGRWALYTAGFKKWSDFSKSRRKSLKWYKHKLSL